MISGLEELIFQFPPLQRVNLIGSGVQLQSSHVTRRGSHGWQGPTCREVFRKDVLDMHVGFTGGSDIKESACNVGDLGLIPGLGRSPGEGKGYPLQYSGLENSMEEEPGRLQSMG